MSCCSAQTHDTGRFFSWFARRYRKRYQRKGLEKSQKQLVAGLQEAGITGCALLEIGCGVGYLHQSLLKSGAAYAVGIDLSDKMIAEARALAGDNGLSDRTDYRIGDFMDIAGDLPAADVTILDKVVCCYPDAQGLTQRSLSKTRRIYALTYPRANAVNRVGAAVIAFLMWLLRNQVRNYIHDPGKIEAWITASGFRKRYEQQTPIWLTQVYVRDE
ncbi:MAG TPA: methyltransferase domain-containing protein [Acidiferrobacterales bacterium]|nr:methyltransferase domain-containing protein [Acidiferrobacterales bacterium]